MWELMGTTIQKKANSHLLKILFRVIFHCPKNSRDTSKLFLASVAVVDIS